MIRLTMIESKGGCVMETVIGMVAATVLCLIAVLDSEVAGKEKVTTVAVLRPPLFCWIYYA